MSKGGEVMAGPRVYHYGQDRLPTRFVYVGRPAKWSNPFKIGVDGTREEVIQKYRESLTDEDKTSIRTDLRGRDLACWCSPKSCHADVLLEIANAED